MKTVKEIWKENHRFKSGELVYRAGPSPLRTVNDTERTIEIVASTEAPDRMGDVIRQNGWNLANFNKNPVFLFSHRSEDPPIGRIVKSVIETGKNPALVQTVQFASKDIYPFADTMFKMFKGQFMHASSVGFMPDEHQPILDAEGKYLGEEFITAELYELSAVPVPANPQALARAYQKSLGGSGGFSQGKFLELILAEAVQRSIINADEALTVDKASALCGDKNPPWAYNLEGVTFEGETVESNEKDLKAFGEWKTASSVCIKQAEDVVKRATDALEKLSAVAERLDKHAAAMPAIVGISAVAEPIDVEPIKIPSIVALSLKMDTMTPEEIKAEISLIAKGVAEAHGYMKSAHKDTTAATKKIAKSIGHMESAMATDGTGDPDDPDNPVTPDPASDPDDVGPITGAVAPRSAEAEENSLERLLSAIES